MILNVSVLKKPILTLCFALCVSLLEAQIQQDDIIGFWRTLKGNTQIEIYKSANNIYYGKIIWLRVEKERPDYKNPNEKLRSRKVLGLQIINNFVFNVKKNIWEKGSIYDPENGETYFCILKFESSKDILKLKGHLPGMKVISRQTEWIRESKLRQ